MNQDAPLVTMRLCREGDDVAILFSRTPVPGRVKSRLCTHLTAEQSCALHVASTLDTAEFLDRAEAAVVKWIFWSDPIADDSATIFLPAAFHIAVQRGETLGDRMAEAFERVFTSGARRVVIFGSDSPTLPGARVAEAFAALDDCDLVLGPAEDGGFYLIGCRRFEPRIFAEVEWSTPRTLAQTKRNAERLGLRVCELEPWYDLDEWKDVLRMLSDARAGSALPQHVAAFFEQLQKEKGKLAPL